MACLKCGEPVSGGMKFHSVCGTACMHTVTEGTGRILC